MAGRPFSLKTAVVSVPDHVADGSTTIEIKAANATATTIAIATQNMRSCVRCGIKYDWRRSPSTSLKMTYCNSLCETADLGYTIDALLRTEFKRTENLAIVDWDEVGELAWAA